jgi:hypothetical protein
MFFLRANAVSKEGNFIFHDMEISDPFFKKVHSQERG